MRVDQVRLYSAKSQRNQTKKVKENYNRGERLQKLDKIIETYNYRDGNINKLDYIKRKEFNYQVELDLQVQRKEKNAIYIERNTCYLQYFGNNIVCPLGTIFLKSQKRHEGKIKWETEVTICENNSNLVINGRKNMMIRLKRRGLEDFENKKTILWITTRKIDFK